MGLMPIHFNNQEERMNGEGYHKGIKNRLKSKWNVLSRLYKGHGNFYH
jgi:hypothetical protein